MRTKTALVKHVARTMMTDCSECSRLWRLNVCTGYSHAELWGWPIPFIEETSASVSSMLQVSPSLFTYFVSFWGTMTLQGPDTPASLLEHTTVAVSQLRVCILWRTRLKASPSETLLTASAVVKCDARAFGAFPGCVTRCFTLTSRFLLPRPAKVTIYTTWCRHFLAFFLLFRVRKESWDMGICEGL